MPNEARFFGHGTHLLCEGWSLLVYRIKFELLVRARQQGMIHDGVAELCRGDMGGTQLPLSVISRTADAVYDCNTRNRLLIAM